MCQLQMLVMIFYQNKCFLKTNKLRIHFELNHVHAEFRRQIFSNVCLRAIFLQVAEFK